MNNLSDFFKKNKINVTEGNINEQNKQQLDIQNILKQTNSKYIMEIGFNAGHSAELFLSNSNAYLYSFDIGHHFHKYLKFGKQFINNKFPNRHTLVLGNSLETIPRFAKNNNILFDVIFIDGGHEYEVAHADLMNCRMLSNNETIIIMDDIVSKNELQAGHTLGPTKAWSDLVKKNLLVEIEHVDYGFGRGQSVGKYINL